MIFQLSGIFIVLNIGMQGSNGARILAFLPMGSHSHQNTYRPIFRALAARGHDVTYVTSIPDDKAPYKQIVVEDRKMQNASDEIDFYFLRKLSHLDNQLIMASFFWDSMDMTLSSAELQNLIHSTDIHFDLVCTESMFAQEAYAAFGHKFQAPTVELIANCPSLWYYSLTSNHYSFAYTVNYLTSSSDRMSFMERLANTINGIVFVLLSRYYLLPKQEALVEKHFKYPGWETRPPLIDLLSNVSLVLQKTSVATHYPHPYNPNIVETAGVELHESKPLPKELQDYLDKAPEGVIYFSLGSIVQGSLMPDATREAFLSAFSKLPYKVLWKWETDLPNKPENVKISKWLPQNDLLGHRNIKAFITHGGLASISEAIYHGVPMITIPLFSDQWKNSKQVEAAGNGVTLDFDNITEQSILWSINTVLLHPSYKATAGKQSRILRDTPMHPVDKAVYWIEYVLRHKGAPHLRTAAASLTWYQYYLVDIFAVALSTVALLIFITYRILNFVNGLLFKKKNNVTRRKKYN